ncbi:MAG: tRNA epoxyqueuosine(34) reductase QueG [Gemmatimonadetes bacterium]|nr:tRNA epoxyqueuosine(34) reductase QueG [Gemmatimonadota bacterium]
MEPHGGRNVAAGGASREWLPSDRAVAPPHPHAHAALRRQPEPRRRPAPRRVALPLAPLVPPLPVPPAPRRGLRAVAHAHGVRRPPRRAAGRRHRPLRTLGAAHDVTTGAAPLEQRLKAQAYGLGFDLAGIVTLGPVGTASAFDAWLAAGHAGEMTWLAKHADLRADTTRPEPGMRSALVVALDYGGKQPPGPVARYARGADYHRLMWDRLDAVGTWLADEIGARSRAYVDTGPVLERDLARKAGLGWFGKNTMLINPERGSFFFLGALFTDAALAPDAPFDADRCGTCTRCLEACPTGAFVAPHVLDANRCISYLTIEHRSEIPAAMRPLVGDAIYGCDICQDVCPWNVSFARDLAEPAFASRAFVAHKDAPTLARDLLALDDDAYRAAFKGSPMKRAKLPGLKRNASVVLANGGTAG